MGQKARTEWVDMCKAIMIYTVLVVHADTVRLLNDFAHAYVLQGFFMLSGYFFNEVKFDKLGTLVKNRFRALLIPYMLFSVLLFLFWNGCVFAMGDVEKMESVWSLLKSMFWVNTTAKPFGVVQYYLTTLFLAEIYFWFICKIGKAKVLRVALGLGVLSVIASIVPLVINFRLPWAADSAMSSAVFIGIGWIARKKNFGKIYEYAKERWVAMLGIAAASLGITIPLLLYNGEVSVRNARYNNVLLYYFNAILITLAVILIMMVITYYIKDGRIKKWIINAGQNTLGTLLLNSTLIRMWEVVLGHRLERVLGDYIYIANAIAAFLCVVAGTILTNFIKKYAPFLFGNINLVKFHKK